jgi:8-oxo-dGTP diphosphatase
MAVEGCGGIIIKNSRVLLIRRQNSDTFDQMWSNPGGKIEPGESVEDAVIRELQEEIGVTVGVLGRISEYQDYKGNTLIGRYTGCLVEIIDGEPHRKETEKIAEVKYFPLDNLPENLAPYTKKYLQDIGY